MTGSWPGLQIRDCARCGHTMSESGPRMKQSIDTEKWELTEHRKCLAEARAVLTAHVQLGLGEPHTTPQNVEHFGALLICAIACGFQLLIFCEPGLGWPLRTCEPKTSPPTQIPAVGRYHRGREVQVVVSWRIAASITDCS